MNKKESESLIIAIIWREEETKCPIMFLSYWSKNLFYVLTRKVFISPVEMSDSFKREILMSMFYSNQVQTRRIMKSLQTFGLYLTVFMVTLCNSWFIIVYDN